MSDNDDVPNQAAADDDPNDSNIITATNKTDSTAAKAHRHHSNTKNWRLIADPNLEKGKDDACLDRIYRVEGFLAGLHDVKYDCLIDPEVIDPRLPKEEYYKKNLLNKELIIFLEKYKEEKLENKDSDLNSCEVTILNLGKHPTKKSLLTLCEHFGKVKSIELLPKETSEVHPVPKVAIVIFEKSRRAAMCAFAINKLKYQDVYLTAYLDKNGEWGRNEAIKKLGLNKDSSGDVVENSEETTENVSFNQTPESERKFSSFNFEDLSKTFIFDVENSNLYNSYLKPLTLPSQMRISGFVKNYQMPLEKYFGLDFSPNETPAKVEKLEIFEPPPDYPDELKDIPEEIDPEIILKEKKMKFAVQVIRKLHSELLKSCELFMMRSILLPKLRLIIKDYCQTDTNKEIKPKLSQTAQPLIKNDIASMNNSLFSEIVQRKSEIPSIFSQFDAQADSREKLNHNAPEKNVSDEIDEDGDDELVPIKIKQIARKRPRMQVNSDDQPFTNNNNNNKSILKQKKYRIEHFKNITKKYVPFDNKKLTEIQKRKYDDNEDDINTNRNYNEEENFKYSDDFDDIYAHSLVDDYYEQQWERKILTRKKKAKKEKSKSAIDELYLINNEEASDECLFDSEDWGLLEEIFESNEYNTILHSVQKKKLLGEHVDLYDPLSLHMLNADYRSKMLYSTKNLLGINAFLQSNEEELNNNGVSSINKNHQRDYRSSFRKLAPMANMSQKYNKSLTTKDSILRFGLSKIDLIGLFAVEKISPNELLIEYCGEVIRTSVADRREEKVYPAQSSYFFELTDYTIIDATHVGNNARFINHSCNPNAFAKIIQHNGTKHVALYSKKEINPGEEITYDYKFPYENNKIPCKCGAYNCRQYLN